MRRLMTTVMTLAMAGMATSAAAQAPGREVRTTVGASVNNLGAQQALELIWRTPRAATGIGTTFTPASARAGVWVEVTPVAALVLRVGAEPTYFFGTFNSMMSFDRRDDAFDTDTRKARGAGASGAALRLYARPTLRLRLGRVIATTSGEFERWSSNATGPFYYEPTRDTILRVSGDTALTWSSAALYEFLRPSGTRVLAGVMHSRLQVNGRRLNQVQKVGAVVVASSETRVWRLNRPSATLAVARYIDDPSKADGWTASLALGIAVR